MLMVAAGCAGLVASAAGTSRAGGPIPCDLALKFGARSEGPPGQFHIDLVVVNTDNVTNASCRVSGFPDVELIGPIDPMFGSIYFVPDQAGRSESVTLRPGLRAHAVLTWLPWSKGNVSPRWVPGYVRVVVRTNRGLSFAMALPWRFGSVLRQDAATHPGTYVGPIRSGAR